MLSWGTTVIIYELLIFTTPYEASTSDYYPHVTDEKQFSYSSKYKKSVNTDDFF